MEQMTGKELTTEQQIEIIDKRGARNFAFLRRWGYECTKIVILNDIEFNYHTAYTLKRFTDCHCNEGYLLVEGDGRNNNTVTAAFYTKRKEVTK